MEKRKYKSKLEWGWVEEKGEGVLKSSDKNIPSCLTARDDLLFEMNERRDLVTKLVTIMTE